MRSITSHKSELTAAIANIFGRNLQHATDEQLRSLISRCETIASQLDAPTWSRIDMTFQLSRQKDGAKLSCTVAAESKVDALRTLAILANIAADREAEKATAQKLESDLHQIAHGA